MFAILSNVGHLSDVDYNDDDNYDHQGNDNDHQGNAPTMSKTTAKKGATANTKNPPMGMKTTSEDETYLVFSRPVSKLYGFGTNDKYALSFDTEGTTDYCLLSFFVNGVLPATGGYVTTLSNDGYTIRWSRPINAFLFLMEHLCSIMGRAYSDYHIQVRSYDEVAQAIMHNKVEADVNGLFWGKP